MLALALPHIPLSFNTLHTPLLSKQTHTQFYSTWHSPFAFPAIPLSSMASSCPHNHWEAPTFHFNSPNQSEDWATFYTRALNYLDVLDIEPDQSDDNHKGWKQLKLMFEGDNRQAFQTLIDNSTIMLGDMKKPRATLDAIRTTIKS